MVNLLQSLSLLVNRLYSQLPAAFCSKIGIVRGQSWQRIIVVHSHSFPFVVNHPQSQPFVAISYDQLRLGMMDLALTTTTIYYCSEDFDMFEILTKIIFGVVQVRLTSNDIRNDQELPRITMKNGIAGNRDPNRNNVNGALR